MRHLGFCVLLLSAFALTALSLQPSLLASFQGSAAWLSGGHDLGNSRNQDREFRISAKTVPGLKVAWNFKAGGDIAATPTVDSDRIYFPDYNGNLYALSRRDGHLIWSHKIAEYDGYPGAVSRVSPAIYGDDLIIGDAENFHATHDGANVIAVRRATGFLHWITRVENHAAAIITGSPVVAGKTVYAGISSVEEVLATHADYVCCSFRGSMVALDAESGDLQWQTYTVPANGGTFDGYSGGAIWQPPAIDAERGLLFIGTGNNYDVPADAISCLARTDPSTQAQCLPETDHYNSALALSLERGEIRWSKRLGGIDVWTGACSNNPNLLTCPEPESPDYDLGGSGPNLLPNLVGFGQKNGIYWALNPDTGQLLWCTAVGPGGTAGGIQWGTATDSERIYVAITNGSHKPYRLKDGTTTNNGAWSALDPLSGSIVWQTADPANAIDPGAVSVANGVLFAPSFSGNMHALDAGTGRMLWTHQSGGSVIDGPAIAEGVVYWGSGYSKQAGGKGNNILYAFSLPNIRRKLPL